MSKGNTAENDIIQVMFRNNVDPAWRTNSNLYVALHKADPGEGGAQNTTEADYTNYARVAVAKTAVGWDISGNQAQNAALLQFPQCGASGCVVTHVSIGTLLTGAGQVLYSGALNAPLSVSNLIQPQFAAGALVVTED